MLRISGFLPQYDDLNSAPQELIERSRLAQYLDRATRAADSNHNASRCEPTDKIQLRFFSLGHNLRLGHPRLHA